MNRREFLERTSQGLAVSLILPSLITSCSKHEKMPMIETFDNIDANYMVRVLDEFTTTYQKYSNQNIYVREAECSKVQVRAMSRPIEDKDIFAGRFKQNPIGFIGQSDEASLGYYMHPKALSQLKNHTELTKDNLILLENIESFWKTEHTVYKTKQAYDKEMKEILLSDEYFMESGIAFTLWRMSGIQMNYHKLVHLGIPGLKKEIKKKLNTKANTASAKALYQAMLSALNMFSDLANSYATQATEQADKCNNEQRKQELKTMAQVLNNISHQKPTTFREGLQLVYLYTILDGARNFGRFDDALGDLYVQDLNNGTIDNEEGIRLLSGIWDLMTDRGYRYDTRLIIGGLGRHNEANANELALAVMETSNRVREIVPQVALRFYKDQDPRLYQKALDVLASGYTFPMLYNDDVNIPAVQKAYDIPYSEAIHAIQYGCGEYVLNHRSVGTPSAIINLLQALLVTMNRGIDPSTGKAMGMPAKAYHKYGQFETFESLWEAYKEQVEFYVTQLAKHEELEYIYAGKDNPYLLTSMLMDDCIERGKGVFEGGIRYLGGTLESYGNSNTADALLAIKQLVYEEQKFTLEELNTILAANFEGHELARTLMLACPKYGNDHHQADEMLMDVHNHLCNFTRDQKHQTNMHSYMIVVINNDANTVVGLKTAASPDGRKAYTHLNPGNNPVGGADQSGITAMLNSIAKPDPSIHAGAVQNLKVSKELFTKNRTQLDALLKTYFQIGGTQLMLTVINRGDLIEAMKYPEKYQNLIVRVGGFSERFINLPRETQEEILSRTLY